ncbi:MAG: hypothetical protein US58_C0004G0036 [Candidatus Magasanikbacteria bacterium GW2011_GWA2_37_8]|uniref:Rod shape-determining protein MreD n=1 Tax=Candidatus Magasanikbacteria bacterium GW2011_GWA2_37_8 TaxID=1619036 RepID=A0A0G0JWG6_9BACT|nr:MAG: hypothetical protein US58_C0004G0036 [Candidatus Magasanikbacteria bacterium GW2011_GWA2_37_8]
MAWLLKKIMWLTLIITVIFLHLALRDWFDFPFNCFNLIFLFLGAAIIIWPQNNNLWLVLPTVLISELFSVVPFGVSAISLFISFLITNWLLLNIITNRSILIVLFAGIFSFILYRLLFYLFLIGGQLFGSSIDLLWSEIIISWLWECVLTIGILVLFYLITTLFTKRFNPSYVILNRKNIF